jgi:pimeloyl-ACP methyl ester carboxylesterase
MRRHPAALRSVTMKGIVPSSMAAPESHAPAGEQAWRSLVDRCRRDAACHEAYPLVDVEFRELLKRLDANPVLTLPAGVQRPAARVVVSRGLFAEAFRNVLYSPDGLAQAPKLIHQLVNGDDRSIVETALAGRTLLGGERLAAGFFLSVTCAESEPYVSKDADAAADRTFGGNYRLAEQRAACKEWPRGSTTGAHRQPVTASIPSLLFSGEFDPVTPPSGGEDVVRHLPKGRHVVVKNNGHAIGNAEACIGSMTSQFLDRASADGLEAGCAAAIPAVPFVIGERKKR